MQQPGRYKIAADTTVLRVVDGTADAARAITGLGHAMTLLCCRCCTRNSHLQYASWGAG